MKKLIFLILLINVVITSCDKDNKQLNYVVSEFETFNKEFVHQKDDISFLIDIGLETELESRKWWRAVLDVVAIASADALGAGASANAVAGVSAAASLLVPAAGPAIYFGAGVLGGVGASWAAHETVGGIGRVLPPDSDFDQPFDEIVELSEEFKFLEAIGSAHNEFIERHYKNGEEATSILNSYSSEIDLNQIFIENSLYEDFELIYTLSEDYVANNFDISGFISSLNDHHYINNIEKEILDLFFSVYLNSESFTDINNICSFYISEIQESNLSKESKTMLLSTFVVAKVSPLYWVQH